MFSQLNNTSRKEKKNAFCINNFMQPLNEGIFILNILLTKESEVKIIS